MTVSFSGSLKQYILPLYCVLPLRWAGKPTLQPSLWLGGGVLAHPTAFLEMVKNAWATKLPTLLHCSLLTAHYFSAIVAMRFLWFLVKSRDSVKSGRLFVFLPLTKGVGCLIFYVKWLLRC